MRDPRGELRFSGAHAVRTLRKPLAPDDFLLHPLARQLVQQGKLVDFCLSSLSTIESPRFPFVSYPDEWTDANKRGPYTWAVHAITGRGANGNYFSSARILDISSKYEIKGNKSASSISSGP